MVCYANLLTINTIQGALVHAQLKYLPCVFRTAIRRNQTLQSLIIVNNNKKKEKKKEKEKNNRKKKAVNQVIFVREMFIFIVFTLVLGNYQKN